MNRAIYLGDTTLGEPIYLTDKDRERNIHMLGLQGKGKTKCMEQMIRQDILRENGQLVLDIQGNLYNDLVRWLSEKGYLYDPPEESKIILINPRDMPEWSVAFNPLILGERQKTSDISAFAEGVLDTILSVNDRRESADRPPLITRVLRAVFYIAIEQNLTLLETRHILNADDMNVIRQFCTSSSKSFITQSEWKQFNALRESDRADWFMGPINRVIDVIGSEGMQRMTSQTENTLDFLKIMDEGYTVLVNLAYDEVSWSYQNSKLLGRLLLHEVTTKARFRTRVDGEHPSNFYLYIDECYEFLNEDLARGMAALRQFGLRFILSHQFLGQLEDLPPSIAGAVRALTGTKICFGIDTDDMEEMGKRIFLQDIDLEEPKEVLTKPGVIGYERQIFHGGGASEAEAEGDVTAEALTSGFTHTSGAGQTFMPDATGMLVPVGATVNTGRGYSDNSSTSAAKSRVRIRGLMESWSEQLVPILADQVGGVYTLDEQFFRKGRALTLLPDRYFALYRPDKGAQLCCTPHVETAVSEDERIIEEQHEYFAEHDFAQSSEDVYLLIKKREKALLSRALEGNQQTKRGDDQDPDDIYGDVVSEPPSLADPKSEDDDILDASEYAKSLLNKYSKPPV